MYNLCYAITLAVTAFNKSFSKHGELERHITKMK